MTFREYYKKPIKESPDLVYSPKGRQLVYYSGGARAFGTVHGIKDVSPFFVYALKSDLTHYDMIEDVFVTLENTFQWEWDEKSKIDKDHMEEKFQNALLFNKRWKVIAEDAGRVAHEVANSPFLINKMKREYIKDYMEGFTWKEGDSVDNLPGVVKGSKGSEVMGDLNNGVRTHLYRNSGRIWPNQRVISFWLTEDQLTPQILDETFTKLKVPTGERVWYAIDVVNMDELEKEETKRKKLPSYGEFKTRRSAPKKNISDEQKRKAQELMAKQHGVAGAQKAKLGSNIPEVGAKKYGMQMPLDVRQQVQTSESLEQFRVSAIEEIKSRTKEITQAINRVIKEPFKVKVIGSVINKDKFTEHSDVDLGVYINSKDYSKGIVEKLSERLQEEFKKIPFSFGILNVIVVNKIEENI